MKLARLLAILIVALAVSVHAQAPRRVSMVITGGIVVTVDGARHIFNPGAVAIDGTDIVAVGPAAEIAAGFRGAEQINAAGSVVIPGLINTHTHAPMVMYRGLADDLPLQDWLTKYIFPAEAKTVSREMVRVGTRLAAIEMIQSGTTTYTDMYYFEEEIARATKAAGLRGVLGQTLIDFGDLLRRSGRIGDAVRLYRKAVAAVPGDLEWKQTLKEAERELLAAPN